jgi:4-amino-4-deoxy-L-arabinose transferase-like glycosyltransferase
MFLRRYLHHWPLLIALLLGLILRIALWDRLPREGLISDEAEYLAAADWLANGRGFAWHLGWLWTRAPLYPLFLAAHQALFGSGLTPIVLSQAFLSLINICLIYNVTLQLTGGQIRRPALLASLLAALYLPFATYTQLILSETLFTSLLLASFLLLGRWVQHSPQGVISLLLAGLFLGFATLTRGLLLGFLPVIGLWVLWVAWKQIQRWQGALRAGACLLVPMAMIILPWTVYASRAYGGLVVVDTTGSFNLLLGARTAFDGGRNDEPVRSFVQALLDPQLTSEQREALLSERRGRDGDLLRAGACLYEQGDPTLLAALQRPATSITQAERQRLMSAEAACLLRATPVAFINKSLTELIDLFQINYTGDERLSSGFTLGRLPGWYALALFLLDDTLYVITLPLAVIGWALLRMQHAEWKMQNNSPSYILHAACCILIGLWLLYNLATAPLLFAINRFRVPLMPFVFVLAAYALASLPAGGWQKLRSRYGITCGVLALLLGLIATTPYAYAEPLQPGQASRLASYLGPYPSSLEATRQALRSRPAYEAEHSLAIALGQRDPAAAQAALADPALPPYAGAVGGPLLDGLQGQPAAGLDRLATQPIQPLEDWQRSLVAGELFRTMGQLEAARAEFGPTHVDIANPVEWAWHWLAPPPLAGNRLTIADDNDLGYIRGFYLGRFDPELQATLRWASGESQLRFPGAGSGTSQQFCMHLTGLGWPTDLPMPIVEVFADNAPLGAIQLTAQLETHCMPLPTTPAGSDIVITTHSPTFIPNAADLLAQQGPQVGQLRRLAFQLDWAEVTSDE